MKGVLAIGVVAVLGLLPVGGLPEFGDWSAPVNLGPVVNSPFSDQCVSISKNGLSLYFASGRVGSQMDLFVAKRASLSAPWGTPVALPAVNSTYSETCPALSLDEHRLYFASTRPGGCGLTDFYVSRRHDRTEDMGWQNPENLGCVADGFVNTTGHEATPTFFEDEQGRVVMYFATIPSGSNYKIFQSVQRADDSFGPGTPVAELNDLPAYSDFGPAVRRDGLEIIFTSTRPLGLGSSDLWTAMRGTTSAPWSAPVNLAILNSPQADFGKTTFSFDGTAFYFSSSRPGGFGSNDLYVTTRLKLGGRR
jgi:hypothetical protein